MCEGFGPERSQNINTRGGMNRGLRSLHHTHFYTQADYRSIILTRVPGVLI